MLDLCGQVARRPVAAGVMPAISAATVTVDANGAVTMAGGVPGEDEQTVSLVGRLLLDMLDRSASTSDAAVPPRLRATALRAASGGRDAFGSLAEFAAALRRQRPEHGEVQEVPFSSGRRRWARASTALIVGALLLLVLAGAGFAILAAGASDNLPFVPPVVKPTPVVPRGEPGWELLRQPKRAAAPQPRDAGGALGSRTRRVQTNRNPGRQVVQAPLETTPAR